MTQFFYVPEDLKEDFSDFLKTDLDGSNYSCTILSNWYEQQQAVSIRAAIHEIAWKSKFTNTDNTFRFLVDRFTSIKKGDMVLVDDAAYDAPCILVWTVTPKPNCYSSQMQKCNAYIELERYVNAEIDSNGTYMKPDGYRVVVPNIPCTLTRANNNYEYRLESSGVGILPNHKILINLQANPITLQAAIGDEFDWSGSRYKITDVFASELDITGTYGLMTLFAEKTNTRTAQYRKEPAIDKEGNYRYGGG